MIIFCRFLLMALINDVRDRQNGGDNGLTYIFYILVYIIYIIQSRFRVKSNPYQTDLNQIWSFLPGAKL